MSKTILRLTKKCNLGNYSEDHKFETFEISVETEIENFTDDIVSETFTSLREKVHEQEHDTLLFFLENSHEEKEDIRPNEPEDENGDLIFS